jgi:hypothetical protein
MPRRHLVLASTVVVLAIGCSSASEPHASAPAAGSEIDRIAERVPPADAASGTLGDGTAAPDAGWRSRLPDDPGPLSSEVSYQGLTLRAGNRVRIKERAGTLAPNESNHPRELAIGPGQVGTVLGGKVLQKHDMEIHVAVVRWDAQGWREWSAPIDRMEQGKPYSVDELNKMSDEYGPEVKLPSYVSSISPAYLVVIQK